MVFMDPKNLRGTDLIIDLECGTNSTIDEKEGSDDIGSSVGHARKLFNKVWSGAADGSIKDEEAGKFINHFSPSAEGPMQNGEASADRISKGGEMVGLLDMVGTEKPKKKGSKKPPKPPRPPKAPLLDAADQKLVRGISEVLILKRARKERMKALKKMKHAKATSSNTNLYALTITVIFCLVIIWQGVFSRGSSSVAFQGSPESSVGLRGGLISVEFYRNVSTDGPRGSSSTSPNKVDQVSALDEHGEASRVAG